MADHPRDASAAPCRLSADAFAALVDRHQHPLNLYLAGLLGNAEQAFDLVQETFYEAWRAAQKGSPPFLLGAAGLSETEVRRWLFRAGSNNALSLLRRKRLIRWESLDGVAEFPTAGAAFDELLAEGEALRQALGELSPQDVACLLLRIVHGFSAAEAGLILSTSADNVNTRLARAKRRLRAAYVAGGRAAREEQTQS